MANNKKTKQYGESEGFGIYNGDDWPFDLGPGHASGKTKPNNTRAADEFAKPKKGGKTDKPTPRRSVSPPRLASHSQFFGKNQPFGGINNPANPMTATQAQNFFAQQKADPIGSLQKSKAPANLAALLAQPKVAASSGTRSQGGTFGTSSDAAASTGTRSRGGTFGKTSDKGSLLEILAGKVGAFGKNALSGALEQLKASGAGAGAAEGTLPGTSGEYAPVPTFGKTLADYLAEAGDGSSMVSGELGAIDARSQALKGQAVVSDEAIAKIYAGLQNSLSKSGEDAGARYAAAGTAAQGVQDGTAATIAAAQKNSESQQAAIRKNLGMEDIAPSAAQNYQAVDQSNAQSALAATGKSQQDYMQSLGSANQDFFTANNAAAGFRGAESRAGLQTDLTSRLAALQDERSSTLAEGSSRAQQLAMQRYQADYGQWSDQRNYSDGLSDKAYDRNFAERQYSDDLTYRQQQMDAEYNKQQAANQPEVPAYDKIQQQLMQAMPGQQQAVQIAMQTMATQKNSDPKSPKYRPMSLQTFLENGLNEQQARLALQMYSEYANAYKY